VFKSQRRGIPAPGKPSGEVMASLGIIGGVYEYSVPAPKFMTNMSLTFSNITKHPKVLTTNDLYFVPYFGAT
jgi:hypothetical protein